MLLSYAIEPAMLRKDGFEGFFQARTTALLELIGKAIGKCLMVESLENLTGEYQTGNGKGHGLHLDLLGS